MKHKEENKKKNKRKRKQNIKLKDKKKRKTINSKDTSFLNFYIFLILPTFLAIFCFSPFFLLLSPAQILSISLSLSLLLISFSLFRLSFLVPQTPLSQHVGQNSCSLVSVGQREQTTLSRQEVRKLIAARDKKQK